MSEQETKDQALDSLKEAINGAIREVAGFEGEPNQLVSKAETLKVLIETRKLLESER